MQKKYNNQDGLETIQSVEPGDEEQLSLIRLAYLEAIGHNSYRAKETKNIDIKNKNTENKDRKKSNNSVSEKEDCISDLKKTDQKEEAKSEKLKSLFNNYLYNYYEKNKRSFAWREEITPYKVLVSEIMLQQTQTDRVKEKFDLFMHLFPNIYTLAQAPFDQVLAAWKGLGYNRRALALHEIAKNILLEENGTLPFEPERLVRYKGIGQATAASICAFAYNKPTVFIETNIRTVFIYIFFKNNDVVHDKELFPLVQELLDEKNPRDWYYALMDYGVMLKKKFGNFSRLSAHYTRQSRFEGSDRQLRGKILAVLLEHKIVTQEQLSFYLESYDSERIEKITQTLLDDNLIVKKESGLLINTH